MCLIARLLCLPFPVLFALYVFAIRLSASGCLSSCALTYMPTQMDCFPHERAQLITTSAKWKVGLQKTAATDAA